MATPGKRTVTDEMESMTRRNRVSSMLETQFQACDDALSEALGRVRDEENTYFDRDMLKF